MLNKIILASKSKVRKEILDKNKYLVKLNHQMLMKMLLKKVLLKNWLHQKLFQKI